MNYLTNANYFNIKRNLRCVIKLYAVLEVVVFKAEVRKLAAGFMFLCVCLRFDGPSTSSGADAAYSSTERRSSAVY